MDVFDKALLDYFHQNATPVLLLHNSYGVPEEMPVEVFFREIEDMPDIELCALDICEGDVLDIGAGVGMHTLILQHRGFDVTALEISEAAIQIMNENGVKSIIKEDIFSFDQRKFDTLLLLMNGIGLVGNINRLEIFLEHAKKILKPDGQVLLDSSDIRYLYENAPPPDDKYYGELSYRYEYKGEVGEWFDWLYIDQLALEDIADKCGYYCQIVFEDDNDQYLARLALK